MMNNLLVHINRKNDMYRDWKSTINIDEYKNLKKNIFNDNLVTEELRNAKHQYYFNTFTFHNNNIKKHGKLLTKH